MPDRYQQLVTSPLGSRVAGQLGLPRPERLRRHTPGQPLLAGPALLGRSQGGRLHAAAESALQAAGVQLRTAADVPGGDQLAALIHDASGIAQIGGLHDVYAFFHDAIRRLGPSGRLVMLASPPGSCDDRAQATAQHALTGFVRAVGKELRRGATAQLVQVEPGAEGDLAATLRFLVSARSAYVSGQVVRIGPAVDRTAATAGADPQRPLAGRVAVVTGAARGIGAAIARVLARDGAHVVCLDLPAQGDALAAVANDLGGSTLQLDITGDDAPATLVDHVRERHDGVDVVVHNAGITRDKTLAGMDASRWDGVLAVNLASQLRLTDGLVEHDVVRRGGRVVCISSLSGIAGNRGQTNYATSKAGVIGLVRAFAPVLADRGVTINAVAPGFIETEMTAQMPVAVREAGRRMNSLSQGGTPDDVAETVGWLADPGAGGVTGQVVRVCGQSLLGA